MKTKKPFIDGVKFLSVVVTFDTPINRDLYDLGSVRLNCEDRTFILDVCQSYTNANNTEIICDLEIDTETFPIGEDTKYDLTKSDLLLNNVKGTLYIGDEYEEEPTSITLFIKSGRTTKAIDLLID